MLLAKLFGSLLLAFAILFDRTPSVQLFTAQIYSDHLALYFSSALVASQTNAHQIMSTFCPYTCQAIIAALESSDEDKEFYEKVWPTLVFGTAPPVKEENWNFGYFLYLFVVIGAVIDTPRLPKRAHLLLYCSTVINLVSFFINSSAASSQFMDSLELVQGSMTSPAIDSPIPALQDSRSSESDFVPPSTFIESTLDSISTSTGPNLARTSATVSISSLDSVVSTDEVGQTVEIEPFTSVISPEFDLMVQAFSTLHLEDSAIDSNSTLSSSADLIDSDMDDYLPPSYSSSKPMTRSYSINSDDSGYFSSPPSPPAPVALLLPAVNMEHTLTIEPVTTFSRLQLELPLKVDEHFMEIEVIKESVQVEEIVETIGSEEVLRAISATTAKQAKKSFSNKMRRRAAPFEIARVGATRGNGLFKIDPRSVRVASRKPRSSYSIIAKQPKSTIIDSYSPIPSLSILPVETLSLALVTPGEVATISLALTARSNTSEAVPLALTAPIKVQTRSVTLHSATKRIGSTELASSPAYHPAFLSSTNKLAEGEHESRKRRKIAVGSGSRRKLLLSTPRPFNRQSPNAGLHQSTRSFSDESEIVAFKKLRRERRKLANYQPEDREIIFKLFKSLPAGQF